jgi:ribosomal protein S18 acetylase RimI-like enzyme
MPDVTIREATATDLPSILRAYAEAGIDAGEAFSPAEAEAHFARFRDYPNYRVLVAESGGAVVGTFSLLIMDNLAKRGTPSGVVEEVAVLPAYQGRGIGRAMMAHALERCREAGCYKMALSSNQSREPAHRFYDSLGFERHGYSFRVRP